MSKESSINDERSLFQSYPDYVRMQLNREFYRKSNIDLPYFKPINGLATNRICLDQQDLINYSSYNYLNLSGHPDVTAAAKKAIDDYGTSVSASRLVGGDRPILRDLEKQISLFLGTEDCLTFVSGHATNVSTIGYLFNKRDLILYDELCHNSIIQGATLSGSSMRRFPHNDCQALENLLLKLRSSYEKVLIVTEGLFSMDGDVPPLPGIIRLKEQFNAILMVDEAHSIGVLGHHGMGVREHFNLPANKIDIYMGTLSKAMAGCGGYIAGNYELIDLLRYHASGFVFSVGLAPSLAAASLRSLEIIKKEPGRVDQLRRNSQLFLHLAREAGLNTGLSEGYAIIPVLMTNAIEALRLTNALLAHKIYVQPMIYPAVKRKQSRLRFFISCAHTSQEITETIDLIAYCNTQLKSQEQNHLDYAVSHE